MRSLSCLLLVAALAAAPAAAEPLADIVAARPCSAIPGDRVGAEGNCRATTAPSGLAVTLRVGAHRLAVALPPGMPLPGGGATGEGARITVGGLVLYNGAPAPEVMRLRAGDTLQVSLRNALPDGPFAATNLHTHGLLVRPTLALTPEGRAREPVGDTVYVCTIPERADPRQAAAAAACALHGAPFGTDPSRMEYRLETRADHPPGLYWYHPHVHGNSRSQVGAGLSGLIWIDPPGPRRAAPATTERFLLLRDVQLTDVAAGADGALSARVMPVEDRDADLCAEAAQPLPGGCFTPEGKGWLFTVNGQVAPGIAIPAGGREVWRIANAGADATYDLALVERGTGRPLRVEVLAADGAAARLVGRMTERILLMPGARVELGISRAGAEGSFAEDQALEAVLRSYGIFTGGAAEFGDRWPAVDLARVAFAAAGAAPEPAPAAGATAVVLSHEPRAEERAEEHAEHMAAAHAGHAALHPGGLRRAAPDCRPLPPGTDRIIALAIEKPEGEAERFMIGTDRARRADPAALRAATARALAKARIFGDGSAVLCARAGTTETWTIVNPPHADNNELHNFHIHQMKFEVLEVVDPTGRIAGPPGRMVDSYPVPVGGSLRIRLRFDARQAGGRFVFHCHILEHEDKGMMAEIQVLPR